MTTSAIFNMFSSYIVFFSLNHNIYVFSMDFNFTLNIAKPRTSDQTLYLVISPKLIFFLIYSDTSTNISFLCTM